MLYAPVMRFAQYPSWPTSHFTAETYRNLQNIMQRSMLISGTGEKERNRFFRTMREEVERRRR
ncbi:MAG: hypothetical protein JNL43_11975 [Flavobacteriales bacterium]|nr:hypothetical protein [Flavobacteriales bacterium]